MLDTNVIQPLEAPKKEAGRCLQVALTFAAFPFTEMQWVYHLEAEEWRLIITTRLADEGPKATYAMLQKWIVNFGLDLTLADISLVSPKSEKRYDIEGA